MTRRTAKTDRPGSDLGRWLLSAAPLLAVALAVGMPADQVAHEVQRFGIDLPIRIDEDKTASHAYRLPGQYGHGDRPSHSFALISSDGWTEQAIHYATMFVPLEELLADLEPA